MAGNRPSGPDSSPVRPALSLPILLPDDVVRELAEFLLDGRTGNVVLNVKDGRVLGMHITRIVTVP